MKTADIQSSYFYTLETTVPLPRPPLLQARFPVLFYFPTRPGFAAHHARYQTRIMTTNDLKRNTFSFQPFSCSSSPVHPAPKLYFICKAFHVPH